MLLHEAVNRLTELPFDPEAIIMVRRKDGDSIMTVRTIESETNEEGATTIWINVEDY